MELAEIVACPRCHAPLELPPPPTPPTCSCGAMYRWDTGVPDLTPLPPPPGLVADRWDLWERLQANGARAYDAQREASLSVGDRVDARLFGAFCELRGRVLDVGCGPQERPAYAPAAPGVELVGIDPLRGADQHDFAFVRGLGEFLPFRDGTFDRVLFGTSLDHLLDPARAVAEARRVLAPGGRVGIWCGLAREPSLPGRALLALRSLLPAERRRRASAAAVADPVPAGAVDAYHFAHQEVAEVEAWIAAAGLRTIERARISEPTSGVFLAAAPR